MVTFAAATNTTSTFPTRAPAQCQVSHFVAITCSDPNDSCDLHNDYCRTLAQLVSPSRDPIGYTDGKSLYSRYFGLSLSDPSGLCAKNKCVVIKATPFKMLNECGMLQGYADPLTFGFKFLSEYEFSGVAPAVCSCCRFEQYVLWSIDSIFVDFGNGYQRIAHAESVYDPDWYLDGYGDPKKPAHPTSDTYSNGGCKYYMDDAPGLDGAGTLGQLPPGALAGARRLKFYIRRQFNQVIRDVCADKQPTIASGPHFLDKECNVEYEFKKGQLIRVKPSVK